MSVPAVSTSRPPPDAISSSDVIWTETKTPPYLLCTLDYLTRLQSTCSWWAFVRVGIVERTRKEEVVQPPTPLVNGDNQETPSPLITAITGNHRASDTTLHSAT